MEQGTVIFLSRDRRFGFLQSEAGVELMFYTRDLRDAEPTTLRLGERLEFDVERGDRDLMARRLARPIDRQV